MKLQEPFTAVVKTALLCIVIGIGISAKTDQTSAFVLSGRFDDVFAGKHDLGANFTVSAFESNALVGVTFDNGFQQIDGTDGHDSFVYYPGGPPAVITYGRFPVNTHQIQQFLWLICVQDPELVANLHNYPFDFYAEYNTNNLVEEVITNGVLPGNFISSIKWYAPTNYNYPKGYLMAELSVTKTKTNGDIIYPSEIIFQQYQMISFDISQLKKGPDGYITNFPSEQNRAKNDVKSVELGLFSITNFQATTPLSSYIPEILDKNAQVDDEREPEMGLVRVASSGKWWTARELYNNRESSTKPNRNDSRESLVKPHRHVNLIFLGTALMLLIIVILAAWSVGKKQQ